MKYLSLVDNRFEIPWDNTTCRITSNLSITLEFVILLWVLTNYFFRRGSMREWKRKNDFWTTHQLSTVSFKCHIKVKDNGFFLYRIMYHILAVSQSMLIFCCIWELVTFGTMIKLWRKKVWCFRDLNSSHLLSLTVLDECTLIVMVMKKYCHIW